MSIRELIEAVEGGDLAEVNTVLGRMFAAYHDMPWDWVSNVNSAFRGSVDAALAFMQMVLPGWTWVGGDMCEGMTVFPPGYDQDPTGHVDAYHADPARAMLLAILKAMEAAPTQGETP